MGTGGRLRRVVIVGATGAGKSTLALRLAVECVARAMPPLAGADR